MKKLLINMDKRGFVFTTAAAWFFVILAVTLTIILAFVFSGTLRFVLIGVGLMLASIFLFGKSLSSPRKSTKSEKIVMLIFFGVGLVLILSAGVLQSIFSVSNIYVDNGKVYWVVTGSANSYSSEYYTFTPSDYTLDNGDVVQPTDNLVLSVSKVDSFCKYTTTRYSYVDPLFRTKYYRLLNNPSKVVNAQYTDGKGVTKTVNTASINEFSMTDPDGRGSIRVQTQGVLSGEYNCPGYENVIIFEGDSNFYDKSYWENYREKRLNTQFTSTLDNSEITSSYVVRGYIDVGNGVFTVTADQEYFDSVIYSPPQQAKPNIIYIKKPTEIQQTHQSSIIVGIRNDAQNAGDVIITTQDGFTYSPTSKKIYLGSSSSTETTFLIQAPQNVGTTSGKITACASSQFDSNVNCDSETFSISVTQGAASSVCGNNICESNENKLTCPQDCQTESGNDNRIACEEKAASQPLLGWTWTESTSSSCGLNPLCIIGITKPVITESGSCKPAFLKYWIFLALIVVAGTSVTIILIKKKKKKRRK